LTRSGGSQLFCGTENPHKYTFQTIINVRIREPQEANLKGFYHLLSYRVIILCVLIVVGGAVDLDRKFERRTIEIQDVGSYAELTAEFAAVQLLAFEFLPQQPLRIWSAIAQLPSFFQSFLPIEHFRQVGSSVPDSRR